MTIGELLAIRAIVAVHAQHNRPKLLAALDAELERERACQQEVTTMQFEEEESMMGHKSKRPLGAALVTPRIPKGLAINELVRSSDD